MTLGERVTVAAIQLKSVLGDKEANLKKTETLILEGVKKGAQLIVLPELFSTGYHVEEKDADLAESIPGETTRWMAQLCQEHSVFLIGNFLEQGLSRGLVYNTCVVVGPNGLIEKYQKRKLWDQEKHRFRSGDELKLVRLGEWRVGLQICYEIGFPEPARELVLKGADMLAYPSAFGKPRAYIWDVATRSRAIENGVFLIAANRSGKERGETEFAGMSRIVNPKGEILAEAKDDDEIIVSPIELQNVAKQRRLVPYLKDL